MTKSIKKLEEKKVHSRLGHFLYSLGAIPSALPYNMVGSWLLAFYTLPMKGRLSLIEFMSMALLIIPLVKKYDIVGAGYASVFSVAVTMPVAIIYLRTLLSNYKDE